jgi:ADP-glucose pyrophosphorylase
MPNDVSNENLLDVSIYFFQQEQLIEVLEKKETTSLQFGKTILLLDIQFTHVHVQIFKCPLLLLSMRL